jgi:DNA repair protein RadC
MVEIVINGCCVWRTEAPSHGYDETVIREAVDAVGYFECIRRLPQEAFAVLALNGGNKPLGPARIVSVGILDSNMVHPREVFADPITDRAAAVILAHNHPSGTLEASAEDIALTKRLAKAGEILGIKVLDHLIVTDTGCLSFKQKGIL